MHPSKANLSFIYVFNKHTQSAMEPMHLYLPTMLGKQYKQMPVADKSS